MNPENWIGKMHLKKNALRNSLHVPKGKKIPVAKLDKAARSDNPTTARRARLALTFRGFKH